MRPCPYEGLWLTSRRDFTAITRKENFRSGRSRNLGSIASNRKWNKSSHHVYIHNRFNRRRYVKIHSERLLDSKAALLHNFEIKAALLHNFEINRKRYGFASFREGAHRISFLTKIYD